MGNYAVNNSKFGTHHLIAEELDSEGELILDVGCNKGYLKGLSKNNSFYGIDLDENSLAAAKKNGYQEVYKVDLNNYQLFKINRNFSTIVMADVLEHTLHPEYVLKFFIENYLASNGKILISLPNVAHGSIRIKLLFGNFGYTEEGILDKTHLHLYTLKSARLLIKSCGLTIVKEKFSSNRLGWLISHMPFLATLLGYNLIFLCRKESDQRYYSRGGE